MRPGDAAAPGGGVAALWPELPIHIDLAELRGYHYHTGVLFAAYVPGQGQAVAQGGRYDEIGQVFGRARPATGFSTDLATLLRLSEPPGPPDSSRNLCTGYGRCGAWSGRW
jgi:ATP phosphoribosyltransferase regulatory subunit